MVTLHDIANADKQALTGAISAAFTHLDRPVPAFTFMEGRLVGEWPPIALDPANFYSVLKASTGSTRDARRIGDVIAASATASKTNAAMVTYRGFRELMP